LILANDLGYTKDIRAVSSQADEVGRLLHGLIGSINERR